QLPQPARLGRFLRRVDSEISRHLLSLRRRAGLDARCSRRALSRRAGVLVVGLPARCAKAQYLSRRSGASAMDQGCDRWRCEGVTMRTMSRRLLAASILTALACPSAWAQ